MIRLLPILILIITSFSVHGQSDISKLRNRFMEYQNSNQLDSALSLVKVTIDQGKASRNRGEIDMAFSHWEESSNFLEILNSTSTISKDLISDLYLDLGWRNYEESRYDYSKEYFIQSEKIRLSAKSFDSIGLFNCYNALSVIYLEEFDFEKSNYFASKATGIILNFKDSLPDKLGKHYGNIAVSHMRLNRLDSADLYLSRSKEIWLDLIENSEGKLKRDYLKRLAINYSRRAEYFDLADSSISSIESAYLKSIELMKEGRGGWANKLDKLADKYKQWGRFAEADSILNMAIDRYQKTYPGKKHTAIFSAILNKADLYSQWGKLQVADSLYQYLHELKDIHGLNHPKYLEHLNKYAYHLCRSQDYLKVSSILSQSFESQKKIILDDFIFLDGEDRKNYWSLKEDDVIASHKFSNDIYAADSSISGLLYNSILLQKGLLLESSIAEKKYDNLQFELLKKQKSLSRQLNKYLGTQKNKRLQDSLKKIRIMLKKDFPQYLEQERHLNVTWKDIQNTLNDNDAAIEFLRYQPYNDSIFHYIALLVRKGYTYPKLIKLCSELDLKNIDPRLGYSHFYPLVWAPVKPFLDNVQTILYSPVGQLSHIPFHSLYSQKNKGDKIKKAKFTQRGEIIKEASIKTEKNADYLMDQFTMRQLISTRNLAIDYNQSFTSDLNALLIGGVNYGYETQDNETENQSEELRRGRKINKSWDYLEGTKVEVKNISKILIDSDGWKISVLTGKNAREEDLWKFEENHKMNLIHIATHGFTFPKYTYNEKNDLPVYAYQDNPLKRCGLILSGANWTWEGNPIDELYQNGIHEDGVLTAAEVSAMDLSDTKLVVLSACETGLGKIEGSEGIFGLKRGFKLAGVEQIIVSLWSVPDKETMELMTLFYEDLTQSLNPVISFEKAQKQMREAHPTRPDLWAGFVLVR